MRDLIGRTLGHYRVVEEIGAGGMGVVYRATDEQLDRDVAIKVLPEKVASDRDRLRRFEREAKAVAALSHPNILEIHEYGRDEGITFAVTELLEGKTLRERLIGGSLGWRKAAEIGAAIAEGVAAAHQAGIVHRDLKPSNVFLTSDDRVKILDFGLAGVDEEVCADTQTATLTEAGAVVGTPGYMSPEQVRGENVDHRSDVFSLGCVLYEMVSGRRAFAGDSAVETLNAILKEEPPDIDAASEAAPPELVGTVRRCLEKRPESRFQSTSDLAYNLRSLSSSQAFSPVHAERPAANRRAVALWLGVVAIVAVVLIWLDPGGWRSESPSVSGAAGSGRIDSLAVLPFVNIGGDVDTAYLSDGIPASIIDRLSELSGLRVVPRSTSFHFRDRNHDLADVARRLEVGAILTGEVSARDETLVIRVELVDVGTDHQLWGERLTGTLGDILATEERIATKVSESLRVELSGEDRARLAGGVTSNPEAHRLYLRARYFRDRPGEEALRTAIEDSSRAIELDPDFALAYWGLSEAWVFLADLGAEPQEVALPKARLAAERALALDENLAEAHGALALLSEYEWDPVTAEREYRLALKLDPTATEVRQQWAYFLSLRGLFEEAIVETRLVLNTDPLSVRATRNLSNQLFFAGRHRGALENVELALALAPGEPLMNLVKARILAGQGRFDEAWVEFERAAELEEYQLRFLGWTYARAGRIAEARTTLDELIQLRDLGHVPPTFEAMVHAGLGENDRAFELLESALAERDPGLIYLKAYPEWNPICDDPRYSDLINRISYFR